MICFSLLGNPFGKQRPKKGKFSIYTPKETIQYEKDLARIFKANYPSFEPFTGAVLFKLTAYFPVPKSTSKKNRALMLEGKIRPIVAPDDDNIAKICRDALNGIAYVDDKQIVDGIQRKFYSDLPRVVIEIKEVQ